MKASIGNTTFKQESWGWVGVEQAQREEVLQIEQPERRSYIGKGIKVFSLDSEITPHIHTILFKNALIYMWLIWFLKRPKQKQIIKHKLIKIVASARWMQILEVCQRLCIPAQLLLQWAGHEHIGWVIFEVNIWCSGHNLAAVACPSPAPRISEHMFFFDQLLELLVGNESLAMQWLYLSF